MENTTGIITDILLETVVTATPALCVENPISQNIIISKTPIIRDGINQLPSVNMRNEKSISFKIKPKADAEK